MKLGAADYLVKDQVNAYLLEKTIRYAIHRMQAIRAILDREAYNLSQATGLLLLVCLLQVLRTKLVHRLA